MKVENKVDLNKRVSLQVLRTHLQIIERQDLHVHVHLKYHFPFIWLENLPRKINRLIHNFQRLESNDHNGSCFICRSELVKLKFITFNRSFDCLPNAKFFQNIVQKEKHAKVSTSTIFIPCQRTRKTEKRTMNVDFDHLPSVQLLATVFSHVPSRFVLLQNSNLEPWKFFSINTS